jgi:predicted nucleic acid-binding Zn ribbon protein
MRGRDQPTPLSEVLAKLLGRYGVGDLRLWERIRREWVEAAGPPWDRQARPLALTDGVLVVEAASAAAVALLRYGTAGLAQRMQDRYGPEVVTEVRVKPPARGHRSHDRDGP